MQKVLLLIFLSLITNFSFAQQIDSTNTCVLKALKYQAYSEFHESITQLDQCLAEKPNDASLYYLRGESAFFLNDRIRMKEDFGKALSLDSTLFNEDVRYFMKIYSDPLFYMKESVDSLIFTELVSELDYRKAYTRKDTLQGTLSRIRNCYDITYQNLRVAIDPESKSIEGRNKITFQMLADADSIQIDLRSNFKVQSILLGKDSVPYSREYNAIFMTLPDRFQKDQTYTIEVNYGGVPRQAPNPPWDGGFVWEEHKGKPYLGVSCEHLGASVWWPTKDHLSEKPDSMDIHIQVPDGLEVVSNGNQISVTDLEGPNTDHHWHVSYPINSYNVTFYVVDKFAHFGENYINLSGDTVRIDYYVLEENLERAKEYYSRTTEILDFFEETFGEYPFPNDGLAFVESPYAGMEHQGAIAIGGDYGADGGYQVMEGFDMLVVHELAHEWWGNSISAADLADVWIQEGFATYAEHLFIEHKFGEQAYINAIGDNFSRILNAWPMVGVRGINYNGFLGQDVYCKGAAMLHNLRCLMDDDIQFFHMIKDFHQQYQQTPVDSKDFTKHAQKYTDIDLKPFFKVFLYRAAPPKLEYKYRKKGRQIFLEFQWVDVPYGFQMPIVYSINGFLEREMVTTENLEVSFGKARFFELPNGHYTPIAPSINSFTYFEPHWIQ